MTSGRLTSSKLFLVCTTIVCALSWFFPSVESEFNQHQLDNTLSAPSLQHVLGTDAFGRDIFFRSLFGLRNSLSIAILASLATAIIGLSIGVLCTQYTSSLVSNAVLLLCDSIITFPGILLALLMVIFFPQGFLSVAVILFLLSVPYFIRLSLVETAQLQSQEFILAAYCIGCRKIDVLVTHFIPNLIPVSFPLVVQTILVSIHIESVLSYFGVGIRPPHASLGFIIYEARRYALVQPSMLYFPLCLLLCISFVLFLMRKEAQTTTSMPR